jgi:hypothetical protein
VRVRIGSGYTRSPIKCCFMDPDETSGSAEGWHFLDLLNEIVFLLHTVDLLRTTSSGQLEL